MSSEDRKAQKIAEQIAEQIAAKIARNEYPSHANLPSIRRLAKEYAVSRITINSALNILENLSMISIPQKQVGIVKDWSNWKFDALPLVLEFISKNKKTLRAIVKVGLEFRRASFLAIIPAFKGKATAKAELRRIEALAWQNRNNPTVFLDCLHEISRYLLQKNSLQSHLWIFNDLSSSFAKLAEQLPVLVSSTIEHWDLHSQLLDAVADGRTDEAVQLATKFFDITDQTILTSPQFSEAV